MSSKAPSETLDLERGLPTDERDVAASRRLRFPRMSDASYERMLRAVATSHAELAAKPGPGGAPFRLPD